MDGYKDNINIELGLSQDFWSFGKAMEVRSRGLGFSLMLTSLPSH